MASGNLRLVGGRDVPTGAARSAETKMPKAVSHDVRKCLRDLASGAEAGDVIGIAYAVVYRGRHFIVNTAGELHRNPTFARGAVAALDDELSRMAWEGS